MHHRRGRLRRRLRLAAADRGSAVVDFVLVGVLVTFLFLAVFQFGLLLHMRNVIVASAAEGARLAANADVDSCAAGGRTRDLVAQALSASIADRLRYDEAPACESSTEAGARIVQVRVRGSVPLLLMPFWPWDGVAVDISAHALKEGVP